MTDFRRVTADFSVAPQLAREDVARAVEAGFRTLVNNRPDGEAPGQPTNADMQAAAEAAGLAYVALPFAGPPPPAVVAELQTLLETAQTPVLAFCRSGTRSITAWALAEALNGTHEPAEIVALAGRAGYDLSGALGVLERLKPR